MSFSSIDYPESHEAKERKHVEENNQPPSPNALKVAATECLNSWIYYLQVLDKIQYEFKLIHFVVDVK